MPRYVTVHTVELVYGCVATAKEKFNGASFVLSFGFGLGGNS